MSAANETTEQMQVSDNDICNFTQPLSMELILRNDQ